MDEHYEKIYKEYEKEVFPLTLLGRFGFMTFNTKEELREFYEGLSRIKR